MALRPTATPLWATDPTFSSGAESGLSPRLDPGAGIRGQGVLPESRIAARWENHVLGVHGDWLAYQDSLQQHAALQQWSAVAIPVVGTDVYRAVVGMRLQRSYGTLNVNDTQRQVLAIGGDLGTSNRVRVAHTADGSYPESTPPRLDSIPSFTNAQWAIAGAAGEIGLVNDGVQFAWTTDSTQTWNASAGYSGPPVVLALHYDGALGYFAITSGITNCFRGTTFANLSASATTSSIATPGASSFVAGEVELASNGSSLVLAATTAANYSALYLSTNGGATWVTALPQGTSNAATRHVNVTWSDYWQRYVCWCDTGEIYTSSTGSTWAQIGSARTPANGFLSGRGTLVSAGTAIVKPTKVSSAYGDLGGVAYSFDLGATWNYHYFAELGNIGATIAGLRGINGRIYATALGKLWRSGVLVAPSVEI